MTVMVMKVVVMVQVLSPRLLIELLIVVEYVAVIVAVIILVVVKVTEISNNYKNRMVAMAVVVTKDMALVMIVVRTVVLVWWS